MSAGRTTFRSHSVFIGSQLAVMYARVFKRIGDVAVSLVLIGALFPVMVVVACLVWAVLGRPILYRDKRAGRGGIPIEVVKFRSMLLSSAADSDASSDEARLTRLGRFLRQTSLDELPQLFCVLNGDMSLVGPRPLPLRYVQRYTPRQAVRLSVRPGLTGWAQIHGRNSLPWPKRFEYDAEYVDLLHRWWAPFLDAWIMIATAAQVVRQAVTGKDISATGVATMREFAP